MVPTGPGPGRGHVSPAAEERRARNDRWQEEMLQFYYEIVSADRPATPNQISAATHLLNRLAGLPVAKSEGSLETKIVVEGGLPKRRP
ncbi:MAG: hypothetical protein ACYDCJ_12450 [Gammaproteobacteria bacterium]